MEEKSGVCVVRRAETEARFWDIIWESEWREDLEAS